MFTSLDKTHAHTAPRAPLALLLAGWVGVFLLAAAGCRTARDNQFDILERELRTQEDYIYELEDYVGEYSEKLRQCRCSRPTSVTKNRSESKSVVKKSKPASDDDRRSKPLRIDEEPFYEPGDDSPERREPSRPRPRTPPRSVEPPALELEETIPEEVEIPELEISEPLGRVEGASTFEQAVYHQNEELVATDDELLRIPDPVAETEPELESIVHDERVVTAERVEIVQLFRSEVGKTPPKTLLAVVEARNADDEPVEFAGEVSLMVMIGDSKKPLRLKRWDFNSEDAASAWQSSHLGNGLHLELPLGETKLPEAPLELWVRIVDQEGRKLLTQLPFEREQLAALEMETGARELLATDKHTGVAEGQLLAAQEPVVAEQAKGRLGWRPATQRTDMDSQGYASTIKKTSGWTSQPAGGRFQHAPPVARRSASTGGRGPVWMTSRMDRTPPTTAARDSQPEWSPQR